MNYLKVYRLSIMRIFTALIFVLILRKFDGAPCEPQNQTQYGSAMNISIREILSYNTNGNDKIAKKIATAISEFSNNYDDYKAIKLSVLKYSFPLKFMEMSIAEKKAFFYNVTATESFISGDIGRKYTTIVGCDLSGAAKIQVSLPTNIEIKANLVLRPLSTDAVSSTTTEGRVTFTLRNGALLRTSVIPSQSSNLERNITYQITYNDSMIHAELDIQNHLSFYNKSKTFVSKIESSVGNYLLKQLEDEIIKRNVSPAFACSKLIQMRQPDKKDTASLRVIYNKTMELTISSLYIIQNPQFIKLPQVLLYLMQGSNFQTDEIVTLSTGPVVIEGLLNFADVETTSSSFDNYLSYTLCDKRLIISIKTDPIKGRFSWYYNLKEDDANHILEFPFSIDYIRIEMTTVEYVKKPQLDIQMGNIEIATALKDNIYSEFQGKLEQIDLQEYLESVITTTLENSILEEIYSSISFPVRGFKEYEYIID